MLPMVLKSLEKAMKKSRVRVSNEQLVLAWLDAREAGERAIHVGQALGISLMTVYSRAKTLRGCGVNLPKLSRKRQQNLVVDAQALNKLISSCV